MVFVGSFIGLFILAHLIGDFVLQTNKVAKMKAKSQKGLVLHFCLIAGAQMILLGIFYGWTGVLVAFIIALIHWLIDAIKIKYTSGLKYQTIYFLVDQSMHLLTILGVAWLLKPGAGKYEINLLMVNLCIAVIIAVYVLSILVQFILSDFFRGYNRETFFEPYERTIDAITALLVLFLMANLQVYTLIGLMVVGVGFALVQKRLYDYAFSAASAKFAVFLLFAIGASRLI